jgi:hypothetical protein
LRTVAALGITGDLDCLFANGRLRDADELRSLEAAGLMDRQTPSTTMSGRRALLETLRVKYPEVAAVDAARRRKELTDMRYPPKPMSGREALLEVMRLKNSTDN